MVSVSEVKISEGCRAMPLVGFGTIAQSFVTDNIRAVFLEAMRAGYRHFDSASIYGSEEPLGDAIEEAVELGIVGSREELFITSKLWCDDAHPELVLPAIKKSLRNLRLEYLDLYLIHLPFATKPGSNRLPLNQEDLMPLDTKSVWEAMEECQRLGLAKAIGVSNFNIKRLEELLTTAKIPPAVNQVEMNPTCQQKQLTEYCKSKGILVTAYCPLGGGYKENYVRDSNVMHDIATSKGKSVAQVALRWAYEQGVSMVMKSSNKERMKENIEIFDWELSDEDHHKISQMPQFKIVTIMAMLSNKDGYEPLPEYELQ